MVHMAFKILDSDGSGLIDINDILGKYNAQSHPDVVSGRRTEREVLVEFLQSFEKGREKNSVITPKEFEDYYSNLSASIDDDDYFELMIRNAWHISGGEGWCANTTNRRVLVKHSDGRETVEEIRNDLGIRAKDTNEMVSRLQKQGLDIATISLNGLTDMKNQIEAKDWAQRRAQLQLSSPNVASGRTMPPVGGGGDMSVPPSRAAPATNRSAAAAAPAARPHSLASALRRS